MEADSGFRQQERHLGWSGLTCIERTNGVFVEAGSRFGQRDRCPVWSGLMCFGRTNGSLWRQQECCPGLSGLTCIVRMNSRFAEGGQYLGNKNVVWGGLA